MGERYKGLLNNIAPLPGGFTDHVFASPHGVDLGVRIWPPQSKSTGPAPFILWFHGGSTVAGTPYSFPPWVIPEFTSKGCYVISAGYRLTPHVSLDEQVQDGVRAYEWCSKSLNDIFGEGAVDPTRWATGGESAGARIATLLPFRVSNKPKVVLDIYGHTTYYPEHLVDPLPPSSFTWPDSLPPLEAVIEETNNHDPTRALVHCPYQVASEASLREAWSFPTFQLTERVRVQRAIMIYYALSKSKNYHGLRLAEHPDAEDRKRHIASFSLLDILDHEKTYPPTVIFQGLADTTVQPKMSQDLEQKLKDKGVPVLALYEPHGPHGFDFVFKVSHW